MTFLQFKAYNTAAVKSSVAGLPSWRYHGIGSSSLEARAYQQRLYGEIEPRADMTVAGQGSITRVNQINESSWSISLYIIQR